VILLNLGKVLSMEEIAAVAGLSEGAASGMASA